MDVLLIGPRGAGKTTVGRSLAAHLQRPFLDLDELVLDQLDASSVRDVFATRGESAWRHAEGAVCAHLLAPLRTDRARVIALGGGTPMVEQARKAIESARRDGSGVVAYLACPPDVLIARLRLNAGDRPRLTTKPVEEEVRDILAARESTYRALADIVLDGQAPASACVGQLCNFLLSRIPTPPGPAPG
jgi:shikimate kinase